MSDAVELRLETIDIRRVARLLERYPAGLERIFTAQEIAYCASNRRKPNQHYAARLAAKFAVRRLLGGGGLREIEIVRDSLGSPRLELSGRAARLSSGISLQLSLSHEGILAAAYVSAESV